MSLFRVKTTECRVGVIGLYNAGKTVFLTSLINHLEHHDPDRFRLGRLRPGDPPVTIRKFQRHRPDAGWSEFNFDGFRDALVHQGRWPKKTRDRSQFVCQFERSDWTFSDALLKLYDLPGERFADTAMHGRSFAEWSEHLLKIVENDTPCRTACAAFLEQLHSPNIDESAILGTYKLALANLILGYKPLISPSSFWLDLNGSLARGTTAEEIAAGRVVGISHGEEFTPLSDAARTANPALALTFAARYERYREQIVTPFLDALRSCHALIVLVDVPALLAAGVGMYNDNRQILRDLFEVLEPGESAIGTAGRVLAKVFLPYELRPAWINRVAFVAPKVDLVHPDDRDRVGHLLERMVGRLATDRDGLDVRFFNCSAVVSTKPLTRENGKPRLAGVPFRGSDGGRIPPGATAGIEVSAVPEDWPADWPAGYYLFPDVYPTIPTRRDFPPDHINLDRVLDFVLD